MAEVFYSGCPEWSSPTLTPPSPQHQDTGPLGIAQDPLPVGGCCNSNLGLLDGILDSEAMV